MTHPTHEGNTAPDPQCSESSNTTTPRTLAQDPGNLKQEYTFLQDHYPEFANIIGNLANSPNLSPQQTLSKGAKPRDPMESEGKDVASAASNNCGPSSFLSMLATALGHMGISSVNDISQALEKEALEKGLETAPETEEEPEIFTARAESYSSSSETKVADPAQDEAPGTTKSDATELSAEIIADLIAKNKISVPPEHLLLPWESSVMKGLLIHAINHGIVKWLDSDTEYNAQKRDILTYHVAQKFQACFNLDDENIYYDRFDVWLIKDVLLQGHLYVTRDAVFFYSLLLGNYSDSELKDPDIVLHEGALGHKIAHYGDSYFSSVYKHKYWTVLRPHTLSIYTSQTKQYFPVKVIDLRTAISCEIIKSGPSEIVKNAESDASLLSSTSSSINEKGIGDEDVQSGVWFKINCKDKTYRFHTSSIYSARHWCNYITKVIFQIRNTNLLREALIKIPIEDILDYRKNFVLSDPDDKESAEANDLRPISFSIKMKVHEPKRVQAARKMGFGKKASRVDTSFEFVHFVAFLEGDKLCQCIETVLGDHVTRQLSAGHLRKQRSRSIFLDDSLHHSHPLLKRKHARVTTVQSDAQSGISIIDKVAEVNEQIAQIRKSDFGTQDFGPPEGCLHRANILSPGQRSPLNFKASYWKEVMLKLSPMQTSSPAEPQDFSALFSNEDHSVEDFLTSESIHDLHFPKPFTLSSLKNFNILFVARQRSFAEIATRYGILPKVVESNNSIDINLKPYQSYEHSRTGDSESKVDSESRFESLKHKVKAFSTMQGIWVMRPEHHDLSLGPDDKFVASKHARIKALNRFRNHFSLGSESHLVASYYAHLRRSIPVYGRLYLGQHQLCFRSLLPGISTKMIVPLEKIVSCELEKGPYHYYGLSVTADGIDLRLEFGSAEVRDDCRNMIMMQLERLGPTQNQSVAYARGTKGLSAVRYTSTQYSRELAETRIKAARLRLLEDRISAASGIEIPLILEDNPFVALEVKLDESYNIVLLTIGSRGDVQPFIALGKGLKKEGHKVTIATHAEFKDWILQHGLNFKEIAGNPSELMLLMVEHGSLSVAFIKEASSKFRGWIQELLETSWEACQFADLLIESPSSMAGIHIAEALEIPYMRAFTMPWTRTRAYPHAFISSDQKRGGSYNFLTHVMFENVFWKGISGQVNKWRVETLGLARTNLDKLQQSRVPFLYNISPAVFPPAVDFQDWVKITGYWFLNEGAEDYKPPADLEKFINKAKEKGEKIVYIGFGSIVVSDARALTQTIVEAVVASGVKCILNKGWSDRSSRKKSEPEIELPPQIYDCGSVPHDWLFPRIDVAVHHGGSGTTGATLRAGLPTIIKPFFGDQHFFASRVEEMGVGFCLKNLNTSTFTKALKAATENDSYAKKAQAVAKSISHDQGVLNAIEAIYTELAYSKSLMLAIKHNTEHRRGQDRSGVQTPVATESALGTPTAVEPENDELDLSDETGSNLSETTDVNEAGTLKVEKSAVELSDDFERQSVAAPMSA